jgi:membrane protein EpsK
MKLYARKDFDGIVKYSRSTVRAMGLLTALPIGLVCGMSRPLLSVWLGPKFAEFAPLLSLMTVHLCVNVAYNPLLSIAMATNNVKVPGLVQIGLGAVNLGMALLMTGPLHWGLYGIAGASAVVLTFKNAVFTPIYAAHLLGRPWYTFMRETLPTMGLTLLIAAVGQFITHFLWHSYNLKSLVGIGSAIASVYILSTIRFLRRNRLSLEFA